MFDSIESILEVQGLGIVNMKISAVCVKISLYNMSCVLEVASQGEALPEKLPFR
jgi:hypothetical protein